MRFGSLGITLHQPKIPKAIPLLYLVPHVSEQQYKNKSFFITALHKMNSHFNDNNLQFSLVRPISFSVSGVLGFPLVILFHFYSIS